MLLTNIKGKTLHWLADRLDDKNKSFPSYLEWRIKDKICIFRGEFYRMWFVEIKRWPFVQIIPVVAAVFDPLPCNQ